MPAREVLDERYELTSQIGAGGMATIWKAQDRLTGRQVALKVLHEHLLDRPRLVARFIREAQAAREAKLSGHVIEVLDVVHHPGQRPYQVMEYLEGEDLDRILEREVRLEPHRAVELIIQICKALSEVHRHGLIHRDIKPENIFVTTRPDGTEWVKLLDFGIVKYSDDAPVRRRALTTVGSTVGTPYYMAPEQAKGQAIDHRADLYATAVVLYEMLTGRLPFDDEDHRVAMQKIARGQPPTLRSLRPELDPALEQVVLKAMATRREARYDTADEFADALAPFSLSPETLERSGPRVETPELRSGAVGDGADAVVPPGPLDMTDKTVVDIRRWRGLLAAIVSGATIITVVAAVIGVIVTRRQCAQEESQFPAELIAGSVAPRDAGVVEAGTESTDAEAEATPTAASSRDGGTSVDRSKVVAALRLLRPAVEPCLKGTRRARTKVHLHFRIAADGDIDYRSSRPPLPRRAEQCLRKALRGRHMDSTGTDPFVATYTYRVPR